MRRALCLTWLVAICVSACGGAEGTDPSPTPPIVTDVTDVTAAPVMPGSGAATTTGTPDAATVAGQRPCTLDGSVSGGQTKSFAGVPAGTYARASGGREYAALDGVDSIAVLVVDSATSSATLTVNGVTYLSFAGGLVDGTVTGALDGSGAAITATFTSPDSDPIVVDVTFTC